MVAVCSETSINFYQNMRRHNTESDVVDLKRVFEKFTIK